MGWFVNGQWYPDSMLTVLPNGERVLKKGTKPAGTKPPVKDEPKTEETKAGEPAVADAPAEEPKPEEPKDEPTFTTKVIEPKDDGRIRTKGKGG